MKNFRSSLLKALLPLTALLAIVPFAACTDPVVIGGNDKPCAADADCAQNEVCVNGACTTQNSGPPTCNGVPSPLSCTVTGCAAGQVCTPNADPSVCFPSSCSCDAATGTWVCTADCGQGSTCIPGNCMGTTETCNGVDDDCDGVVDNATPGAVLCPNGGVCANGQCGGLTMCTPNGACPPGQVCDAAGVCVPVSCTPAPEACNGLDDDCDGQIDEQDDPSVALCQNGAACVTGQCGGSVPCASDMDCGANEVCQNGMCTGATCTTEMCNGIDDDCDGVVDNATPGTTLCANGAMCVNGSCGGVVQCGPNSPCPAGQVCNPNGVCQPGMCVPAPETCNGKDDDCDGVVDDATPGAVLCPNNAPCVNGACIIQCANNAQCPSGMTCQNGLCK